MQCNMLNKPTKISTRNTDIIINIETNDKIKKTPKEKLDDMKKKYNLISKINYFKNTREIPLNNDIYNEVSNNVDNRKENNSNNLNNEIDHEIISKKQKNKDLTKNTKLPRIKKNEKYNQEQSSLRLYKNLYPKSKYGIQNPNKQDNLPSINNTPKRNTRERSVQNNTRREKSLEPNRVQQNILRRNNTDSRLPTIKKEPIEQRQYTIQKNNYIGNTNVNENLINYNQNILSNRRRSLFTTNNVNRNQNTVLTNRRESLNTRDNHPINRLINRNLNIRRSNDEKRRNQEDVLKLPHNVNNRIFTEIQEKTNDKEPEKETKKQSEKDTNKEIKISNENLQQNKLPRIERQNLTDRPGTDSRHKIQTFQNKLQAIHNLNDDKSRSKTVKHDFTCPICLDIITSNKNTFNIAPCDHKVCITCMKNNIKVALTDLISLVPIKCPYGDTCKTKIDPELNNLSSIMDKKDYSKLLSTHIMKTYIESKFIKNCPNPDCGAVYDGSSLIDFDKTLDEENFQLRILCPECNIAFCSKCNVKWHEGLSCKEYKDSLKQKDNLNSLVDKNKAYIQNYCKKCPTCKAPVQKTQTTEQEQYEKDTKLAGGTQDCNHMTCTNCKVDFCWTCLKTYRGTEYYHHDCPSVDVNIYFYNTTPYIKNLPFNGVEYIILEIYDNDKLWKRNIYTNITHRRTIQKIKNEIKSTKIVTVYCNTEGVVQKIKGKTGNFCFRQENYGKFEIDDDDPIPENKFIANNRFNNRYVGYNNQRNLNNLNNQLNFIQRNIIQNQNRYARGRRNNFL